MVYLVEERDEEAVEAAEDGDEGKRNRRLRLPCFWCICCCLDGETEAGTRLKSSPRVVWEEDVEVNVEAEVILLESLYHDIRVGGRVPEERQTTSDLTPADRDLFGAIIDTSSGFTVWDKKQLKETTNQDKLSQGVRKSWKNNKKNIYLKREEDEIG